MSKRRIVTIAMTIMIAALIFGSSAFAATVTIETHRYNPIAPEEGGTMNRCADPLHASAPKCPLVSWALTGAGDDVHHTSAIIRDIKITTIQLKKHISKGDLEKFVRSKAKVQLRDVDTNSHLSNFEVVSVSGVDILKLVTIPAGSVSIVSDVGLAPKGESKAVCYIQTKIHLVYEKEDEKKDSDNKKDNKKNNNNSSDNKNKNNYKHDTDNDDDDYYDIIKRKVAEEKRKYAEQEAKEKAIKENLKKHTAQISPKERENDTDVADAQPEEIILQEGPDKIDILLIIAAIVAALVYGYLIRSDLKVMRWYKQKKALRK
jgi:hypothetical protein